MANYVRFQRGTREAYKVLKDAQRLDDNTLYFIYPDDNNAVGELYLGARLISGGDVTIASASLNDLLDVVVTDTGANSFLVLNDEGKWESKNIDDVASLIQENLDLESGTSVAQVFQTDKQEGEDDLAAIARIVNGAAVQVGDIAIVRTLITEGKFQHTAYVHNGSSWAAMDGNYSAENVYFNSDFTFTKPVGVVTIPSSGSQIVEAEGKNIKEFLASIFAKEEQPTITANPKVTLTVENAGLFEVGSKTTPSFSASLSAGSYKFGPATGVAAESWSVASTAGDSFDINSGTCAEVEVIDNINYSITATATHNAGTIAKTNIGNNSSPIKQIQAGSKTATAGYITGYRKTFYGTTDNMDTITSDVIRGLAGSSTGALANGATFDIELPVGAKRVIIAYPATLRDLTSVKDDNGMQAEIVGSFKPSTVDVEGANGYQAITYDVYVAPFSEPLGTANIYHVTI